MNQRAVITGGLRGLGTAATRRGVGGLDVVRFDIAGGKYVEVDTPDGNPYLSVYSASNAITAPEVLDHTPALIQMKRVGGLGEMAELMARFGPESLSCSRATHRREGVPA